MLVAMNAQFYPILLSWCPSRSVLVRNLEKIVEGLIHLDRRSETPFVPAVFFQQEERPMFCSTSESSGFFRDRSLYGSKTDHDDDELGGDVTSHHGGISDVLLCKRHYITVNGLVSLRRVWHWFSKSLLLSMPPLRFSYIHFVWNKPNQCLNQTKDFCRRIFQDILDEFVVANCRNS